MSNGTPDVIIIGGGVIGCATAYFLGLAGLRCTIVERDGIGSQASGFAAGELSPIGRTALSEPMTRFCMEGLQVHRAWAATIEAESGIRYHLADVQALHPAFTEDEAREAKALMAWAARLGFTSRWLDAHEVRALGSWLADDVLGATVGTEAQLETPLFAQALARAAERQGATIEHGEVTGLHVVAGRATGVMLGGRLRESGMVVLANGPWVQLTTPWTGIAVPVAPVRGQIVELDHRGQPPRHAIFHRTGYVMPKAAGKLLVGTTEEDAGFDRSVTQRATDGILAAVRRIAPRTASLAIKQVTACLRPVSRDGLPFIGALPGLQRAYVAAGHGRKGIVQSLATGKYLAQVMTLGHADYPLDAFSPARLPPRPGDGAP